MFWPRIMDAVGDDVGRPYALGFLSADASQGFPKRYDIHDDDDFCWPEFLIAATLSV